jgi:predicted kinase
VLDAVFLRPKERQAAETAAGAAAFQGLWLDLSPDVMAQRISSRTGDASDADVKVLEQQLRRNPGPITWKRIAPGQPEQPASPIA